MANMHSPARMRGRISDFCRPVPKRMMAGPTALIVRKGTGAPARCASSKNTNCSTGVNPCPPYSSGQPTPSHPSRPICRTASRLRGPPNSPVDISSATSGVTSSVK